VFFVFFVVSFFEYNGTKNLFQQQKARKTLEQKITCNLLKKKGILL